MKRVLMGERKDGAFAWTMGMTRPSSTWMNESESPTWVTNTEAVACGRPRA